MIGAMRLVLAVSALLVIYIDLGQRDRALREYSTLQRFDQEMADRLFVKIPKR